MDPVVGVVLPEVAPAIAVATVEGLEDPDVEFWMAGAVSQALSAPSDSNECNGAGGVVLDIETFTKVVSLPDEVLGELLANLDAALGAFSELCSRGDVEAAAIEILDAQRSARLVEQRMEQMP